MQEEKKAVTDLGNAQGDWATEAQLNAMRPKFYDMRQTAITANGATWNYCGSDKWFKTSDGYNIG